MNPTSHLGTCYIENSFQEKKQIKSQRVTCPHPPPLFFVFKELHINIGVAYRSEELPYYLLA
jgi:hypothetical protein